MLYKETSGNPVLLSLANIFVRQMFQFVRFISAKRQKRTQAGNVPLWSQKLWSAKSLPSLQPRLPDFFSEQYTSMVKNIPNTYVQKYQSSIN
jgi:hypothetical protein